MGWGHLGDPDQLSIPACAASLPSRPGPCWSPGRAPAPPRDQHHCCGTSTTRGTRSGTCREAAGGEGGCGGRASQHGSAVNHHLVLF